MEPAHLDLHIHFVESACEEREQQALSPKQGLEGLLPIPISVYVRLPVKKAPGDFEMSHLDRLVHFYTRKPVFFHKKETPRAFVEIEKVFVRYAADDHFISLRRIG
jgi:hypothetical protein